MPNLASDPDDAADDRGGGVLRILVVDADDRTRESIVGILGIRHRFEVVGSAAHIADAIAIARTTRPDVVILDPRLPDVSGGLALIRRIHVIDPEIRILAVGWSPDLEHQALTAGADCFVRKTFKPGDLAAAVARCMESRALSHHAASHDAASHDAADPDADRAEPVGLPVVAPASRPTDTSTRSASTRGAGVIL
jgi:DNA-binding NarL/FixJ family response regulator